jgi:hypothetical protein
VHSKLTWSRANSTLSRSNRGQHWRRNPRYGTGDWTGFGKLPPRLSYHPGPPPRSQLIDEPGVKAGLSHHQLIDHTASVRQGPAANQTGFPDQNHGLRPRYVAELHPSVQYPVADYCLAPAFWTDQHTPNLPGCCPRDYQPPEVRIHRLSGGKVGTVWSMEADIWAVACIVRLVILIQSSWYRLTLAGITSPRTVSSVLHFQQP